jgi:hypothetical protein
MKEVVLSSSLNELEKVSNAVNIHEVSVNGAPHLLCCRTREVKIEADYRFF